MTYNDSDIEYGSNRELVFHGTIAVGIVAIIVGLVVFVVPTKDMPSIALEITDFTELAELNAAETTALTTTKDNGDGTHTIPIDAAQAALVANPELLSTAFSGAGADDAAVDADPLVTAGKALFASKTCFGCHSTDGSRLVGPSFKGLSGKEEKLADGSTVTVDDAYLAESIVDPNAKVVEGYPPAMPPVPMSDEDVAALVAYINSLQ